MLGSGCDHSDDLVTLCSDSIAETAPYVDRGVLIEYTDGEIFVYSSDVDDDCAAQVLLRVTEHLQGA